MEPEELYATAVLYWVAKGVLKEVPDPTDGQSAASAGKCCYSSAVCPLLRGVSNVDAVRCLQLRRIQYHACVFLYTQPRRWATWTLSQTPTTWPRRTGSCCCWRTRQIAGKMGWTSAWTVATRRTIRYVKYSPMWIVHRLMGGRTTDSDQITVFGCLERDHP